MKQSNIFYLLVIISLVIGGCSSTRFPANNETKEDYLENKKERSNDPTSPEGKYDKDSGKGGGVDGVTD